MLGQSIFREGIEPEYEDPHNMNGGHIRIVFSGSRCKWWHLMVLEEDREKFPDFWETIVLSVIGETLDDEDNITGIRVIDKSNPHKKYINYRVEVWFKNWEDERFKNLLKDRIEKIAEVCEIASVDISFSQNDYKKWETK